jgi:hypothetical protein
LFWKREVPKESPTAKKNTSGYTINDLKQIVDSQKGKELDGYSPYGAFELLVRKSQNDWKQHVNTLLSNISNEILSLLHKLSNEIFGRFPNLNTQIKFCVDKLQGEVYLKTSGFLGYSLQMENRGPFTLNKEFLSKKLDYVNKLMESNNDAPNAYPVQQSRNESLKRAMQALGEIGVVGLTPNLLLQKVTSNMGDDGYIYELFASALAYFDISSMRFIDQICLSIDFHFLKDVEERLEKELVQSLGILDRGKDELSMLIVEERGVQERRDAALERLKLLELVWKRLQEFSFLY